MKYVLVSGGGMSGIGKGIIASSTGLLLKTMGLKVTAIKIDPYLNIGKPDSALNASAGCSLSLLDAGTMKPTEHGEVFVLDDGGEVDLDLGNYERYLQISLGRENNITTGKIYQSVIARERHGDFLGHTVQVVPHITDATQDWIQRVASVPVDGSKDEPDVCIIELGGTVGDIESAPFIESMRRLRMRAGAKENFLHIHVTYVPVIHGEQKTKLVQQAMRDVRSAGLFPDLIACRCERVLEASTVTKIAQYCQVDHSQVVAVHDVLTTYHVPVLLESQGMLETLRTLLRLGELSISKSSLHKGSQTWTSWRHLTQSQDHLHESVSIALVGKYTALHDSYLSVIKSLEHAAMACSRKLNLIWVESSHLETATEQASPGNYHKAWHEVCTADGLLVPGGFGTRGIEGMIAAAKYARTTSKPYLGICLGMQIAVVEYARHVCNVPSATSEEIVGKGNSPYLIIIEMLELDQVVISSFAPQPAEAGLTPPSQNKGASMRLGLRPTTFQPGSEWSKLRALYGKDTAATTSDSTLPNDAPAELNGTQNNTPNIPNGAPAIINGDPNTSNTTTANGPTTTETPALDGLIIQERHRHRFEVNPAWIDDLTQHGLSFVGKGDSGLRMEIMELKEHPWYVGVQYHPEYLSRVLRPSKPYLGFVAAASGCLEEVTGRGRSASVNGIGVSADEGVGI